MPNTLEAGICAEGLNEALGRGRPWVFNTDKFPHVVHFTGFVEKAWLVHPPGLFGENVFRAASFLPATAFDKRLRYFAIELLPLCLQVLPHLYEYGFLSRFRPLR